MTRKKNPNAKPLEGEKRTLNFGTTQVLQPTPFKSNFIRTSKYSIIDFLPKSILLQFNRYANIYFLVTAIVQSIPQVSPLSPFSAIAPFVFVMALSIIREGYEDYYRHKSDRETNAYPCLIYRNNKFEKDTWKNIHVGDIIKVKDNEFFPADIVSLNSSNEFGVSYMETSSLDGEKNLKPRQSLKETIELTKNGEPTSEFLGKITCDQPDAQIHKFDGFLQLDNGTKSILGPKNFMLRGTRLKNTEWVIGVVVYTGFDTKVMKNAETSYIKVSNVEATINNCIMGILVVELILCIFCAAGSYIWNILYLTANGDQGHAVVYLGKQYNIGVEALINFFAYFLLLNTMIPISLIVTLEFVKLFQSFFIMKDQDMYNNEKKRFANVSSTSIIEELGQVEYIFTDKTGTLTCNRMEFKLCMIGNKLYGDRSVLKDPNSASIAANNPKRRAIQNPAEGVEYTFNDRSLGVDLRGEADVEVQVDFFGKDIPSIRSHRLLMNEFMKCLSLCHDCVIEAGPNGEIQYQGPSPDEVTLVDFAKRNGYCFKGTRHGIRVLDIFGAEEKFELLQLFEFDSNRKRMSVIIKDSSGAIKLYVKGADTVIKSRLSRDVQQRFLTKIDAYVEDFSLRGLRTLLIAMRVMTPDEYKVIEGRINSFVEDPEREDKIKAYADQIETNLTIIGATAVEDQLQDEVPETIRDLLRANLKVWMLTGDKLETAENIGRSCNLISPKFTTIKISEQTKEDVEESLKVAYKNFVESRKSNKPKALLIEGEALAIVFEDDDYKKEFYDIARHCESVICCRVNPKQKAEVVRLIRNNMHKITLAIGDGANDVNMIQAAHIGVGIYGEEGMRAAQAADFAIPEFKNLWRLLFVHGRWSYIRLSEMVLYFFYKNMVVTLTHFFFAFVNVFSAQTVFDDWYISLYNTIFTALPLVVRACFDQDVYYKKVIIENKQKQKVVKITELPNVKRSYPLLYYVGMENRIFNVQRFVGSCIKGVIHSLLIFLITYFSLRYVVLSDDGYNGDMWYFSITMFTSIILVVDLKLALFTRYWTLLMWIALLGTSLGVYFGYMWIANEIKSMLVYESAQMLWKTPFYYLIVLLNVGTVFLVDVMYIYIKKEYFTETIDYISSLIKTHQENNENKFEMVESKLMEKRKQQSLRDVTSQRTSSTVILDFLKRSKSMIDHEDPTLDKKIKSRSSLNMSQRHLQTNPDILFENKDIISDERNDDELKKDIMATPEDNNLAEDSEGNQHSMRRNIPVIALGSRSINVIPRSKDVSQEHVLEANQNMFEESQGEKDSLSQPIFENNIFEAPYGQPRSNGAETSSIDSNGQKVVKPRAII